MIPLQRLATQTAVYGLSTLLGRFINYLLVPFYTSIWTDPSRYGTISEFYAYAMLFNIVYLYGMETAYLRFSSGKVWTESQVYGNIMGLLLLSSAVFSGMLWVFAPQLAQAMQYEDQAKLIRWLALIFAIDACTAIPYVRLRWHLRAWTFVRLRLCIVLVNVGLNIFFLYVCRGVYEGRFGDAWQEEVLWVYRPAWDIEYVFLANLLSSALLIPLFYKSWRTLRVRVYASLTRAMLKYAYPLMLMGLFGVGIEALPRVLFKHLFQGAEALRMLGVFSACAKLAIIMVLAVQAYRYAAEPFIFASAADREHPERLALATKWFIVLGSLIFVGISLHLDILSILFLRNEAYREGIGIVPILLMGHLWYGVYYNVSAWFKLKDKTTYGIYFSLLGVFLTLVGNILAAPLWGYWGIAVVMCATYGVMLVVSYLLGRRWYPVPYRIGSALWHMGVAVAIVVLAQSFSWGILWKDVLVRTGICLVYAGAVLFFERKNIGRTFVKKHV